MSKVNFVSSYTATSKANVHDVWSIWADVNNWSKWDSGIAQAEIRNNFKAGTVFSLTPQGGEPIEVELKTVTAGEEFSDEAVLPFGVIRNFHRVEKAGEQIHLTHEVRAEINADAAGFFSAEIWPHMQKGLPEAVHNILALVSEV